MSISEAAAPRRPSIPRSIGEMLFPTADRSTTGLEPISRCISIYHGDFFLMASAWKGLGRVKGELYDSYAPHIFAISLPSTISSSLPSSKSPWPVSDIFA